MVQVILGLGLIAFGVVATVLGGRSVGRQARRNASWRPARATVVDREWRTTKQQRLWQYWVLERTDDRGRTHRTRAEVGTNYGSFGRLPEEVDVLVDPHDESSFVLAGGMRSGWGMLPFVIVGVLFTVIGLAVIILALR